MLTRCFSKQVVIFVCSLVVIPFMVTATNISTPDIDDIEFPGDEASTKQEVELGKTLFFDTRLSSNYQQSCASCHNPDLGFGDGLAKGIGTMGGQLGRNTPHLYNLAWSVTFFWDGRASSLEEQALSPIEASAEMNLPISTLLPRLQSVPYYRQQFSTVYGSETITKENLAKAIAAFERSIISANSPFDAYIAGNKSAMSPASIRGMDLFQNKAQCTNCHDGANFTDDSFHNLGINDGDFGRAAISNTTHLEGAFKTPGLRNTLLTAPYMHDGSLASLEDVIQFYNRGGGKHPKKDGLMQKLQLTDQEVMDLVAFLGALTSPVVVARPNIPELSTDVSAVTE